MAQSVHTSSPARAVVWAFHMLLPALGLWLLLARPELDVEIPHQEAHFWLVTSVAAINMVLAQRMSDEAGRHGDVRLFLVSLGFLAAAGFFALHALATPRVLVTGSNAGFLIATPVGMFLAAVFGAASALELSPARAESVLQRRSLLRGGLWAVMLLWAFVSLFELPPLARAIESGQAYRGLLPLAAVGVAACLATAVLYYRLYRRRPSAVLMGLITAYVLLAEAMVNVVIGRNWHLSWWEWHVLLLAAFGYLAYSARVQYRQEGSARGLFASIALDQTIQQLRHEYGEALEALVGALEGDPDDEALEAAVTEVVERFGLTQLQREILRRAAEALASERDQIRRLDALVAVGRETRVGLEERELLRRTLAIAKQGFEGDRLRLGLVVDGELQFPAELAGDGGWPGGDPAEPALVHAALEELEPRAIPSPEGTLQVFPLAVKGSGAGVLEVLRAGEFDERDTAVLRSLASQLSVALENARLYRQVDRLLHRYLSPNVATALRSDAELAELGGRVVEATVLFADLRGFTSYSEQVAHPQRVVELLNRYFGLAVPIVLAEGGTVDKFVGDALMALFNWPEPQPDHALRAARAALAIQAAVEEAATDHPDWPRFRVGINTGPALVGNVGSGELRNLTAIGDAVNLAARLQTAAEPGQVVIGPTTYALVRHVAGVRRLGSVSVKGREEAVEAFELLALEEVASRSSETRR
ncbi:MAG TPA: adenylate/guanylate cyclase domain-containing protein [Nitriliruptorales bacterium]|nr:adenylate/guanylate cyclase domain-containing protein [Nitriliruptorales bacterium]